MYEPFGPFTIIWERGFLLVFRGRISLLIEKDMEEKVLWEGRVFLPSSVVGNSVSGYPLRNIHDLQGCCHGSPGQLAPLKGSLSCSALSNCSTA
jgi:hypothetical protein